MAGIFAIGVLVAIAVLFQRATRAGTLTEFDSINLAKALQDFDVSEDQPHAPGYPLVVGAVHALHWGLSTLNAYLVFDLLASLVAVVATYWLGREMFGRRAGVVAALLLCATPLFLYYVDVVSVYPAEAAIAPVVALLAYRVACGADQLSSLLLLPALAIGGGFRPSALVLLAPMCLCALVVARPNWGRVAVGGGIGAAIVLGWLIPTVIQAGGLHDYLHANSDLYGRAGRRTSLLHGASLHDAAYNVWVTIGGTALVALPTLLILAVLVRRLRWPGRLQLMLLVAWIAPYLALYGLGHFGKPGYALGYLPALVVLAAGLVREAAASVAVASAVAAIGMLGYLAVPSWGLPDAVSRRSMGPFLPTAYVVRSQDRETRMLRTRARECVPPGCSIISLPGSPLTWNHVASAMQRWYAPDSFVRDLDELRSTTVPRGTVLWVGARVPAPVRERAHYDVKAGYWSFYRSSPTETKAILDELVR